MSDLKKMSLKNTTPGESTLNYLPTWAWVLWLLPLGAWLGIAVFTTPTELFLRLNQEARALPDHVWVFFNLFGNGWYVFALASPLLVFAPRLLIAGVFAGAITGAMSRILKLSLQMPRPASVLDQSSFYILGKPLTSLSMPSGHTLTAFSIATAIYFSADPKKRQPFMWLFLLAIGAGFARIAVGAHWPADTLAGAALGLFGGVTGAYLACRLPVQYTLTTSWPVRIIGACALLCIYMLLMTQIDFALSRPFQQAATVVVSISLLLFLKKTFHRSEGSAI